MTVKWSFSCPVVLIVCPSGINCGVRRSIHPACCFIHCKDVTLLKLLMPLKASETTKWLLQLFASNGWELTVMLSLCAQLAETSLLRLTAARTNHQFVLCQILQVSCLQTPKASVPTSASTTVSIQNLLTGLIKCIIVVLPASAAFDLLSCRPSLGHIAHQGRCITSFFLLAIS